MIISPQLFENEQYSCKVCNADLTEKEINNDWKCVHCNNRVSIKVGRKILVRKLPHEIEEGEVILLRATEKYHEVLNVLDSNSFEQTCSVNLEEEGNRKFTEQWINVMWNNNHLV